MMDPHEESKVEDVMESRNLLLNIMQSPKNSQPMENIGFTTL